MRKSIAKCMAEVTLKVKFASTQCVGVMLKSQIELIGEHCTHVKMNWYPLATTP